MSALKKIRNNPRQHFTPLIRTDGRQGRDFRNRNADQQQYDGIIYEYALSPVWHVAEVRAWAF